MEEDIADRIRRDFPPAQAEEAITLLEETGRSNGRIARSIIVASGGDLVRLRQYIEMADTDSRDVIIAGEYDPGWRRLRDLRVSFLIDAPEKFWIGDMAAALHGRGYVLRSLDSRRASLGPFQYTADEGEGVAEFVGEPFPITIEKANRQWKLLGDPNDLELYDLNRPFDDESSFRDALSCYVLAKQRPNLMRCSA